MFDGLKELTIELNSVLKNVSNTQEILEIGAKDLVKDLLKLTKPISNIKKSTYTHLIKTFTYEKKSNGEIEVGWGKYYGRMVEEGTSKTLAKPHLRPTFEINKEKYYKDMIKKIYD